jgi:hypothetical protein
MYFNMRFNHLFRFAICTLFLGALLLTSACKKDSVSTTTTSSKCDYAPYAAGSKFVYSTTGTQTATDTITGDTTINSVRYAKVVSTGPSASGTPSSSLSFARCDDKGIYLLLDKAQIGAVGATNFTAKEIQAIKLPASIGLSWKSDTIKYTTSQGANVALVYKMQETALAGSKTVNGTVYANDLVTVQIKLFATSTVSGFTIVDSSYVANNIYDKKFGLIEVNQGGTVTKSLKSSIIK